MMTNSIGIAQAFTARTTRLLVPERATPGVPFELTLTVHYDGPKPCLDGTVIVVLGGGLMLAGTGATIDGRPLGMIADSGARRAQVAFPPLAPYSETRLTIGCVLAVPGVPRAANHLEVVVSAPGSSLALSAVVTTDAAPAFAASRTFAVVDDGELGLGERRRVQVVLHNEGTATASNVSIETVSSVDVDAAVAGAIAALAPGETQICVGYLVATGPAPRLELRVTHDTGAFDLPALALRAVQAASLAGCLEYDGDLPVPTPGGLVSLRLVIVNEGERPALTPTATLCLPRGAALHGHGSNANGTAVIALPTIAPHATIERSFVVDLAPPDEAPSIAAILADDLGRTVNLAPIELPVENVSSCVVERLEIDGDERLLVGEPRTVTLDLFADGNVPIGEIRVATSLGPTLEYLPGSLTLDGIEIDDDGFVATGELGLADLGAGELARFAWAIVPMRATTRGATTIVSCMVEWAAGRASASTRGYVVSPAPRFAATAGRGANVLRSASTVYAALAAGQSETNSAEHLHIHPFEIAVEDGSAATTATEPPVEEATVVTPLVEETAAIETTMSRQFELPITDATIIEDAVIEAVPADLHTSELPAEEAAVIEVPAAEEHAVETYIIEEPVGGGTVIEVSTAGDAPQNGVTDPTNQDFVSVGAGEPDEASHDPIGAAVKATSQVEHSHALQSRLVMAAAVRDPLLAVALAVGALAVPGLDAQHAAVFDGAVRALRGSLASMVGAETVAWSAWDSVRLGLSEYASLRHDERFASVRSDAPSIFAGIGAIADAVSVWATDESHFAFGADARVALARADASLARDDDPYEPLQLLQPRIAELLELAKDAAAA